MDNNKEKKDILDALEGLIIWAELNICPHDETVRGGIWEICNECGARWADDRGGRPEDAGDAPKELKAAYEVLSKHKPTPEQKAAQERERAIDEMLSLASSNDRPRVFMGKLYDAGYRKTVDEG